MRRLTALLHTLNDGLRLGRCLETLFPCDEILIIDGGSTDQTTRIAREYGARIVSAKGGTPPTHGIGQAEAEWLLCLDACESLTEGLAASLFEWKSSRKDSLDPEVLSVFLRVETPDGWVDNPEAQTRLVPGNWQRWNGIWPVAELVPMPLSGELLRFSFP